MAGDASSIAGVMLLLARAMALTLLLSSSPVGAQNPGGGGKPASEATYTISGMVVSSRDGRPLAQTRVSLSEVKNRLQALWVTTSEDGRFEFASVPAGKFSLEGAKRGFLVGRYQQHEEFSTAIVTGAGFHTENLVLRLTPLGLLRGTVVDEAGDPVRNAQVRLFEDRHGGGTDRIGNAGTTITDDQGLYEFAELPPGNYYVSVSAKPWYAVHPTSTYADGVGRPPATVPRGLDVAYPMIFYNGATDSAGATPISVAGGDPVTADVHLGPVPALHLFVHPQSDGQQNYSIPMLQKRAFDSVEPVMSEGTGFVAPGVWELVGIPAGRYSAGTHVALGGHLTGSFEVDLTSDGQEIETPPSEPSASLKVSVKMARGGAIPKGLNLTLRTSRGQFVGFQPIDPSGAATFEGVPAGNYSVLVNSAPPPYTIARISSQGVETAGHDITVLAGASMELSASIVAGVVRVEGFAKRGGKAMPGVMIALVPKEPQTHPERFRRDQSDMDGSFALGAILPGSYTLIAVEDAWEFPWRQEGALDRYVQHGENLTIGEGMNGTVVLPEPVEVQHR